MALTLLTCAGLGETSANYAGPYVGACDASAVVPVGNEHFLAASDEDSVLRLYERHRPGRPIKSFDLTSELELGRKAGETDLEGAALIGDVAYWVSSHARSADGKKRSDRGRFFATRLSGGGGALTVELIGRPCKTLVADLIAAPQLAKYDLAEATTLSPKDKGGLNIEGLCADGRGGLLIGFRNPIPKKQALLVPLRNPAAVVQGGRAEFGTPVELDLGKLGIRDLAFHDGWILIAAGPRSGADEFVLFAWRGLGEAPRPLGFRFTDGFSPEGAVLYADTGWGGVQLFSDDSSSVIADCECKDLADPARKQFRSRWVELPTPGR